MGKHKQLAKVQDKYDRLHAELHRKFKESDADNLKQNMLSSEMDEKWDELYTFLETHVKNLEITDDACKNFGERPLCYIYRHSE